MNLNIRKAPYLVVMERDTHAGTIGQAVEAWNHSEAKRSLDQSVLYQGVLDDHLVLLYEVKSFEEIQRFIESDAFHAFIEQESEYMASDFHQAVVGLVEDVIHRDTLIPQTDYMQLRYIEVPLSDIDSYLLWRKRRIFAYVQQNDKVESFLAFHSVLSSTPGVLFVTEVRGDIDEYRESFLTPAYREIIQEAGHDHIKDGEGGLKTTEYKRVG